MFQHAKMSIVSCAPNQSQKTPYSSFPNFRASLLPPTVIDKSWAIFVLLNLEQHQIQQCKVPASWRKITDAPASHELIYDRSCHLQRVALLGGCDAGMRNASNRNRQKHTKNMMDFEWMLQWRNFILCNNLESSNWNNNLKVDVWVPGMYDQDGMCWDLFLKRSLFVGSC